MARLHKGKGRPPLKKIPLPNNIGTLSLFKKVSNDVISFDILYKNVQPSRFTKSKKLTDIKKAEAHAIKRWNNIKWIPSKQTDSIYYWFRFLNLTYLPSPKQTNATSSSILI